jgi:hypothetical protein
MLKLRGYVEMFTLTPTFARLTSWDQMSEDLNFKGDDYEWLLTIVSASNAIPKLAKR